MRVVVLMGGDSREREISLVSGDAAAKAIKENGHDVIKLDPAGTPEENETLNKINHHSIEIDSTEKAPQHDGHLYLKNILTAKELKADVVFNALHGGSGENGTVQAILDMADIPYTGSGMLASALAMQKDISKQFFKNANIPAPRGVILSETDASSLKKIDKNAFPQIVKPSDQGSTIGLSVVNCADEFDNAIKKAFELGSKVIVETYIEGREIAVGVLNDRALPLVEIIPEHEIYDYECKYQSGKSNYITPAKVDNKTQKRLSDLAIKAHQVLGCRGYSRVDFKLTKENEPFILEVNTLPGLTPTSLFPKGAAAVNINFNALIEMIIEEALK
jgi:D-alanine-D-alanine ligase